MPRNPEVSRTLMVTDAHVLCLNVDTGAAFTKVFTLSREYDNEHAILSALYAEFNADGKANIKPVHVKKLTHERRTYSMSTQQFVTLAKVKGDKQEQPKVDITGKKTKTKKETKNNERL